MTSLKLRQWILSVLSVILAGVLLTGCGAGASDKGAEKLELKIADISTNPVFRVAASKGIFDKHGIKAELVTFATPAEGINSLFIKQVDVAFGADFPLLNALSKGDYSIFASTGTATERSASDWKLFVRDEITNGTELKGKKLSFMRGTFLPYLWDVYLADHGLKLSDAELIGQGAMDEAYVALKKGEVDAVWVYSAINHEKFKALSNVHELSDMSKTSVRLGTGLIATNKLIADHPEQLVALLKAIDEAADYAQGNPEETADLMYEAVKQPRESTLKDLPVNPWSLGFTEKAYEGLQGQKNYMVETGIIEQDFELNDKLNLDLLRKAFPDRFIELK